MTERKIRFPSLRKTSCASKNFYLKNKRVAQLGFPRKPSCANVKFYL